jgi:uncharacterized protein YyaL (SSP411 family)
MPNRLAQESSPYLLQHKDNPVDWYPWGDEAFERAKAEDKPVFLSVGYSSCHWCHVMAHESFESSEVAKLLNKHFVSVKVDREERPDVDETYMAAVHLTNGRGGWPMSVFLTPDKKPFFAGTYFPKHDRGDYPGMMTHLRQIAEGWASKRAEFEKVADEYVKALDQLFSKPAPATFGSLSEETLLNALQALAADADLENGGFGSRPKFPPHTAVEFLLQYAATGPESDLAVDSPRGTALALALNALYRMALGGIHDHVGGGFHRYSTDERWLVPHFEKMLYDNALLLASYARASEMLAQADPEFAAVAQRAIHGIVGFVERELTSPEGLFYSAVDADSEGVEGRYYVWTEEEVRKILGSEADAFLNLYGFEPDGNFTDESTGKRTGANIPHLADQPDDAMEGSLAKLRAARDGRVRPGTDQKALVGWNGLMIGALAEAGFTAPAARAALAILKATRVAGHLPRLIASGKPEGLGFLEDYAYFVQGLAALANVTGDAVWAEATVTVAADMVRRFYDDADGGFWATSEEHETLFNRTKPVFDQPIPSANSVAIRCLIAFGELDLAGKSLAAFHGWLESAPQSCEGLILAAMEYLDAARDQVETVPAAPTAVQAEAKAVAIAVSLRSKELRAGADGWASAEVLIEIPEGWHVNSNAPDARWLIPTEVSVEPLGFEVAYPTATGLGYVGETVIPLRLRLPKGESGAEFEVTVRYQACTETECLEPQQKRLAGVVTG